MFLASLPLVLVTVYAFHRFVMRSVDSYDGYGQRDRSGRRSEFVWPI